jgi:hypothetical protein
VVDFDGIGLECVGHAVPVLCGSIACFRDPVTAFRGFVPIGSRAVAILRGQISIGGRLISVLGVRI